MLVGEQELYYARDQQVILGKSFAAQQHGLIDHHHHAKWRLIITASLLLLCVIASGRLTCNTIQTHGMYLLAVVISTPQVTKDSHTSSVM